MVNQVKWWDVLFKTQRYLDFCNHIAIIETSIPQLAQFELVQNSLNNTQNKLQEANRKLSRANGELSGLRVEMGKLQTAYDMAVREANSLGDQLAQTIQTAKPKAQRTEGRGASSDKEQRYGQQYAGGQVHSTPADNTSLHMQAAFAAQTAADTPASRACTGSHASVRGGSSHDSSSYDSGDSGGGGGGCD